MPFAGTTSGANAFLQFYQHMFQFVEMSSFRMNSVFVPEQPWVPAGVSVIAASCDQYNGGTCTRSAVRRRCGYPRDDVDSVVEVELTYRWVVCSSVFSQRRRAIPRIRNSDVDGPAVCQCNEHGHLSRCDDVGDGQRPSYFSIRLMA